MVHYAVVVDGKVIGSRSSKRHVQQVYTHAVVVQGGTHKNWNGTTSPVDGAMSYHTSHLLAVKATNQWRHLGGTLTIEPVIVTEKRAKVAQILGAPCQGHPAGPADPMGETVYCDGSCRRGC